MDSSTLKNISFFLITSLILVMSCSSETIEQPTEISIKSETTQASSAEVTEDPQKQTIEVVAFDDSEARYEGKEFFEIAFRLHPDPTISTDLVKLLDEKKLAIGHTRFSNAYAMFRVLSKAEMERYKIDQSRFSQESVPTIIIDPVQCNVSDKKGRHLTWAVIRHEYEHYLQWQGMTDPLLKDSFYREGAFDLGNITDELCTQEWKNEVEAHEVSCTLIKKYNLHSERKRICRYLGNDSEFDLDVLSDFYKRPYTKRCVDIWNQLRR